MEYSSFNVPQSKQYDSQIVLVVCNFTPVPQERYEITTPFTGFWREVLNSDAKEYGGSGWGNFGGLASGPPEVADKFSPVIIAIPPLGIIFFVLEHDDAQAKDVQGK